MSSKRRLWSITTETKDLEDELRTVRYKVAICSSQMNFQSRSAAQRRFTATHMAPFRRGLSTNGIKDSDQQLERGNPAEALRLLKEMWKPARDSRNVGAAGRAIDLLIGPSVDRQDYRQARHFLADLVLRDTSNPVVTKWRDDLAVALLCSNSGSTYCCVTGDFAVAGQKCRHCSTDLARSGGTEGGSSRVDDRFQILKVGVLASHRRTRSRWSAERSG